MTYNRDDDCYYRRELQALQDNIEDTNASLLAMLVRLRRDEEPNTWEARVMIFEASRTANEAAVFIQLAMARLPEPVTA